MKEEDIEKKNRELREKLPEQGEKKASGITNVSRRIKAVYGDACGISMESGNPKGLRVTITIKVEETQ